MDNTAIENRLVLEALHNIKLAHPDVVFDVFDGECYRIQGATDANDVLHVLRHHDSDTIFVRRPNHETDWLDLSYGGVPFEVISDYPPELDLAMLPVWELIEDHEWNIPDSELIPPPDDDE